MPGIALVSLIENKGGKFDEILFFSSRWGVGIGSGHPSSPYKVRDDKQLKDEKFIVYGDRHIKSWQVQLIRQITGNDSPAIAGYAYSFSEKSNSITIKPFYRSYWRFFESLEMISTAPSTTSLGK